MSERGTLVMEHLSQAREEMKEIADAVDPVAKRRAQVRAASHFRAAANLLDDNGLLTE